MAKTPAKADKGFDFEKSLAELEQIIEKMEQGDLSLEEALKDFERGIELTRACQQALQQAEQKVKVLVQKGGVEELLPFAGEEGDDEP
jgi:exodeoxyribonuclease VII small subunit